VNRTAQHAFLLLPFSRLPCPFLLAATSAAGLHRLGWLTLPEEYSTKNTLVDPSHYAGGGTSIHMARNHGASPDPRELLFCYWSVTFIINMQPPSNTLVDCGGEDRHGQSAIVSRGKLHEVIYHATYNLWSLPTLPLWFSPTLPRTALHYA
jgi:hypothetical protein